MVQDDAQRTALVLLIAKTFVDSGDRPVLVGQLDPAHPHRHVALKEAGRRNALHRAPTHNRKTIIKWILCRVATEIGQGAGLGQAERLSTACHGRFEQDRPKIIAIIAVDIGRSHHAGRL